jgi:hypothetical protein
MDILDYTLKATGATALCPVLSISFRVVDSLTQTTTITDNMEISGKHILFPQVIAAMTPEEKQELITMLGEFFIEAARRRAEKV